MGVADGRLYSSSTTWATGRPVGSAYVAWPLVAVIQPLKQYKMLMIFGERDDRCV